MSSLAINQPSSPKQFIIQKLSSSDSCKICVVSTYYSNAAHIMNQHESKAILNITCGVPDIFSIYTNISTKIFKKRQQKSRRSQITKALFFIHPKASND